MSKVKFQFDKNTLTYRKVVLNAPQRIMRMLIGMAGAAVFAALVILIFTTFFDSPKEKQLKREIAEMQLQYKLLRNRMSRVDQVLAQLQEKDDDIYRVIFEAEPIPESVRDAGFGGVNRYRDLEQMVARGEFREDLYYRLAVVTVHLPPLRERIEDVELLARHFIARSAESSGLAPRDIGEDTVAAFQAYAWPGNVRQLRNIIDWILIMAPGGSGDEIGAAMLPVEIVSTAPSAEGLGRNSDVIGLPLREAREIFEREYLHSQVSRFGGNISRTAAFIGMERSALHRKLKSLGIHNGRKSDRRE